ncbi:xaa-Pro aminopeptidase ApepP-like [Melitaea cinxia]|uniref:xaa-Pro aminopeptidase ApepP-like n=1 Tax=Melitaea cinxia TaxID=113334 RepID=UPI001E2741E4|nr:xaa-Pro aminopeptidase ApepP-like [Melitaea cinxia]
MAFTSARLAQIISSMTCGMEKTQRTLADDLEARSLDQTSVWLPELFRQAITNMLRFKEGYRNWMLNGRGFDLANVFEDYTDLWGGIVRLLDSQRRKKSASVQIGKSSSNVNRQISMQRLTAVLEVMREQNIDALIVPTADAHNSQYIAPSDARREWLSGLSGSSGTALVTETHALVWTDGRYFTQFEVEVDTSVWGLMRQGTDLTIDRWLLANLNQSSVVGIDPTTYTRSSWNSLEALLRPANISVVPTSENIVDEARRRVGDPAPARPNEPLLALPSNYTGKVSGEKISELLTQIRARQASVLILTALDDIAYTLNIRGSDIPFNPVFFSYLVIRADIATDNVILFWGNGTLPSEIQEHLSSEGTQVVSQPYSEIFNYLRNMSTSLPTGSIIWLTNTGSHAVFLAAETNKAISTLSTVSPVALMKCVKNEVELQGFRASHIRDGVAVVRFLRWVHEQVSSGNNVTEINVVDKLDELRGEEDYYKGLSFPTIAGTGSNGAIIHYNPSREGPQEVIQRNHMLLVDSGGQYLDGTTDITRTRHMSSNPTPAQRRAFTRVLKGQIQLATVVFPRGSTGNVLETLARKFLWDVGLNYAHGTGHGVGHFLNVHEGPSGIGAVRAADDPGIVPGMIFSNEPGYYEVGEYGIRHEDIVEVIEMNQNADHIFADGLVGNFSGVGAVAFYTISLAPHQTACLDVNLLSDLEITYLNNYHARVLSTLGPILRQRNLTEDYEWLENECAPIYRSAAILFKLSPFLLLGVGSMWLTM